LVKTLSFVSNLSKFLHIFFLLLLLSSWFFREIFNQGRIPYLTLELKDFAAKLFSNDPPKLDKTDSTPPKIYDLLLAMTRPDPLQRPSLQEVIDTLQIILSDSLSQTSTSTRTNPSTTTTTTTTTPTTTTLATNNGNMYDLSPMSNLPNNTYDKTPSAPDHL